MEWMLAGEERIDWRDPGDVENCRVESVALRGMNARRVPVCLPRFLFRLVPLSKKMSRIS
jgi:hypothetical protein